MSTQPSVDFPELELNQPAPPKRKKGQVVTLVVAPVLLLSLIAALAMPWVKVRNLEKAQRDLQFSLAVTDYNSGTDLIQPTVNAIQFLRRGYSITFDSVKYTQEGLELRGRIGNPTNLWITSLALNFSARPYPYQVQDKFFDPFSIYSSNWHFGNAQTTVGVLNPGSTSNFAVTIPNVKQTPDGLQIAVSFSGEYYQYLGR